MKILHVNAGLENGGGLTHIVSLLSTFDPNVASLLTFAEGPVAQAARQAHIKVQVLHQSSRYSLSLPKQLKQAIIKGGYDIVHTHGARANLFMNLIHKQVFARWVITVHSDPSLDFMGRGVIGKIFTKLNLKSLANADQIDVVTKNFYHRLIDLGVPSAHMRVIYNGVAFHDQPLPAVSHPHFTAMIVARLHPVKNHAMLLKAFAQLPKDCRLRIVGSGDEAAAIKAQIQQLGLDQQVQMLGQQTQAQIRTLLQTTDVSVLTSLSESFPLVLLESADAGVPVITTAVGDVKVMIPEAALGWVVPVNDVQALVKALLAAKNEAKAGELANKGLAFRAYAQAHFSLNQLHDSVQSGYDQLLGR